MVVVVSSSVGGGCCCCCSSCGGFRDIDLAAERGTKEGFAFEASRGFDGKGASNGFVGGVGVIVVVVVVVVGLPDMTLIGWTFVTGAHPVFFGFCC